MKDGKPFQYVSGSIHYHRVHPGYWRDRILKMRAAGLNAVQFYIPWNFHEDPASSISFYHWRNLTRFLDIVHSANMLAIARIGPYICAEWDNGGLPWWLLKDPEIQFRQSNPQYLEAVQNWWGYLLPNIIRPMLYSNGGPIVMIQIENEYGLFHACDHGYMSFLKDLAIQHLGTDVVYFTTDRPKEEHMRCGTMNGTFATVDFGMQAKDKIDANFKLQRKYNPQGGPLVDTEFYPGRDDLWGQPHQTRPASHVVESMRYIYKVGASLNFYMFHGGTNFGYWSGVTGGVPFSPVTTTYDWDAPISEAGDLTYKFTEVRQALQNLTGVNPPAGPKNTTKIGYGTVVLKNLGSVVCNLHLLSPHQRRVTADYPLTFEAIDFPYGFVLYETKYTNHVKNLTIDTVHDRAYVMQDGKMQGIVRREGKKHLSLNPSSRFGLIQILLENQGRHNSGKIDRKGILGNVSVDGIVQMGWTMYPIDIDALFAGSANEYFFENENDGHKFVQFDKPVKESAADRLKLDNEDIEMMAIFSDANTRVIHEECMFDADNASFSPSIFYGEFSATSVADTFFDSTGWGKGQLFINGNNVGRHWSKGPQVTLFVPKYFLKRKNIIVVFELENPAFCTSKSTCAVNFTAIPNLGSQSSMSSEVPPYYT